MLIGQAAPNVQDLATARGSAGVIYDIIDRVSMGYFLSCILHNFILHYQEPEMQISESDQGLKPEKFKSDVRLTDVSFCYPSRSTVQVTTVVLTVCIATTQLLHRY